MHQNLIEYIKQARHHKIPDAEITANLQRQGWRLEDIHIAFLHVSSSIHAVHVGKLPSTWQRYWADMIDMFVLEIPILIVVIIVYAINRPTTKQISSLNSQMGWFFSIAGFIAWVIYTTYFLTHYSATIGKDAYGLAVFQKGTQKIITRQQAVIREIIRTGVFLIPIIGGLIWLINGLYILFSPDKRGFHDMVAGTHVVKIKPAWSMKKQFGCLFVFLIPIILIFIFGIAIGFISHK